MRALPLVMALVSVHAVAAEPVRSSNVVLLEAVGKPVDVDALRTSLEDWLRSMQLELHLVGVLPPPEVGGAFARVRVVWTDETCVVEIFGPTGLLRRRKALPRGGPALLVSEAAALVAQAGVQELSVEESRRAPPPAPVTVAPVAEVRDVPAEAPAAFGLGLAAFLQGRGYGAVAPVVFGGGAEVTATFGEGPWHPQLSFSVAYQGPVTDEATLVSLQVQLQTISFRVLPSLRRKVGPFEVDFALGGGLDALIAHGTSQTVSSPSLRADGVDLAPFFTAGLGMRLHLTQASAVFLRAVVDLDPARRRYTVSIADQSEHLLVPWQARPALQLGFSFDLLSRTGPSP
ncbi:MAG: hypothetical protein Q8N23_28495 [Archangium sp.]|nr:hypothetical protein [Archangium sp.]MDP3570586.1 hypothetical protein [Archangium sp.]